MVILREQAVYLLAGTEQYLKAENLKRIKSTFLARDSSDFNFNLFYATDCSAREVLACAHTLPFLSDKRLVLVRQVEQFSLSDQKLILSYVQAPNRHTLLVLETTQTNLKTDFLRQLSQYAQVTFCRPFVTQTQVLVWVRRQVAAQGCKIKTEAQHLLVHNLGNDLQALSNSLESLILYIGERKTITAADVEKLAGADIKARVFDLFAAVSAGKKTKAWQILDGLLKEGIKPAQILGAITQQIVAQRERIDSFLLKRILLNLQNADSDIKMGRQSPRLALELLLSRCWELFQFAH